MQLLVAGMESVYQIKSSLTLISPIGFVTPTQRHEGLDAELLQKRVEVYEAAKQARPERWSGDTRNWQYVSVVHLNPDQKLIKAAEQQGGKYGAKNGSIIHTLRRQLA